MTGTPKIKPPKNNAEWARGVQKRQDAVENPASSRTGKWVLSTDENDNLIASFANGGSVVLAKPPQGEDPDEITTGNPFLKLARGAPQTTPANTRTTIQWDTIVNNVGNWGITSTPVTTVGAPVSGTYLVVYRLCETGNSPNMTKAYVTLNESVIIADEILVSYPSGYYRSLYLVDVISVNAGALIECGMFSNASMTVGASGPDPANLTSLSLYLLEAA